jgi:small multidrug resistance family-3 protein
MNILQSLSLFVMAGLAEIGGAYLIWQWIRVGRPPALGLLGVGFLFVYGVTQTLQAFNFGRVFAGYGGIFIVLATLWSWWVDGRVPDRWDWIGAGICLVGVAVILWAPRR